MAAPRQAKLKVFRTQIGFFDTVIAVPSQAAALRAWGVSQNLFAEGRATLSEDGDANRAALEHPGVLLRRPVGTNAGFEIEPRGVPNLPAEPPRQASRAKQPPRPEPAPKKVEPDRSSLTRTEAALTELEAAGQREEADFRRRQADLDQDGISARLRFLEKREAAEAALTELEAARRREEADFSRRRADLDQEGISAKRRYLEKRKAAEAAVNAAKRSYRAAGGRA
jgi:hypothetical protein